MTAERFWQKAVLCLRAAETLRDDGDAEGACNRAYYAIHNAARSALFSIGEENAASAKTHSGLTSQFNLLLCKPGRLDPALGGVIALESQRRLLADYQGDPLSVEDAREAITNATGFLAVVQIFMDGQP